MSDTLPALEEVEEAFGFLEDWEDRYRYIMDLGGKLPPLSAGARVDENLVHGCQSAVWVSLTADGDIVHLNADSDSQLVKGLAAIVVLSLRGKRPEEVVAFDFKALFDSLGLNDHLSPTRSNGLHGMVTQVRARATAIVADA